MVGAVGVTFHGVLLAQVYVLFCIDPFVVSVSEWSLTELGKKTNETEQKSLHC